MQLSIIILNYKTKNLVKQCIKNIENLGLELDYEIIVVDNNSADEIEEMIAEDFSGVKFIQTGENKGMGAGNNAGVKVAQGKYILILNPDVVVLENSIERLLSFIKDRPKVGCVAPQLLNPNKTHQQSRYRFPEFSLPAFIRTDLKIFGKSRLDKYFMEDMPIESCHKIDWARGSALLFRKNVLDKINGFDERFFMYMEDVDLCRRVWQADYEIWYVPEAKMIHYYFRESGGSTWIKDLFKPMAWKHIGSWIKYFWKYRSEHTRIITRK